MKSTFATAGRRTFPPVTTLLCREMQPSLYRYVFRATTTQQLRLIALTLLIAPLSAAPLELQRRMVNNAIETPDLRLLLLLGAAYLGIILLQELLKFMRNVYEGVVGEGVIRVLRRRVASGTEPDARSAAAGANGAGARVSMISFETEQLGSFVGESITVPLLHLATFGFVVGYMLWVEPAIALFALAIYLPILVVVPILQNRINRWIEERTERVRALGDDMAADEEPAGDEEYNEAIEAIYGIRVRVYNLKGWLKAVQNTLSALGPVAVIVGGGWLAIEGETELGTIVAFISGYERLISPSRELIKFYRRMSRMRVQYRMFADAFR